MTTNMTTNMTTIDKIVQEIQHSIMIGDFLPKQRLVETELAQRFSVGRTMIRESLRILEDRGSVVTHSNKGAMVTDLSPKEIRDIYFLRTRLEQIASILAFDNLYQEFWPRMPFFRIPLENDALPPSGSLPICVCLNP